MHLQRQKHLSDVEYCFRTKVMATETLKKDYPNKAKQIKITSNIKAFDSDTLTDHLLEEETVVYEMFHKKTKYCKDGYYVKFTDDLILEMDYLFSHMGICHL